jgi:uncharacterized membrane protein YdjX (TVP38/TMEM64 family)
MLLVALLVFILVPFALFDERIATVAAQALTEARREPAAVIGLIVVLLALDAVLPIPSSVVSTFAGVALGWGWGAAAVWVGATLGGLVGYALGRSAGRGAAMRLVGAVELARAHRLVDRVGPLALILTRAVPVVGEAATLLAGVARMRLLPFLAATGIGNLAVAITYAGIGSVALSSDSFLLAFAGLILVPALGWGLWRAWRLRSPVGRLL